MLGTIGDVVLTHDRGGGGGSAGHWVVLNTRSHPVGKLNCCKKTIMETENMIEWPISPNGHCLSRALAVDLWGDGDRMQESETRVLIISPNTNNNMLRAGTTITSP